jgi:hypothetical protein
MRIEEERKTKKEHCRISGIKMIAKTLNHDLTKLQKSPFKKQNFSSFISIKVPLMI